MTSRTPLAVGLKPSAMTYKGRLRGLLEPAQAGFVAGSPQVEPPGEAAHLGEGILL